MGQLCVWVGEVGMVCGMEQLGGECSVDLELYCYWAADPLVNTLMLSPQLVWLLSASSIVVRCQLGEAPY